MTINFRFTFFASAGPYFITSVQITITIYTIMPLLTVYIHSTNTLLLNYIFTSFIILLMLSSQDYQSRLAYNKQYRRPCYDANHNKFKINRKRKRTKRSWPFHFNDRHLCSACSQEIRNLNFWRFIYFYLNDNLGIIRMICNI